MCFSGKVSYIAGGILLSLGLCCISICCFASGHHGVKQRLSYFPLAIVPLLFGMQQITEGFVWSDLQNETAIGIYMYMAYAFWCFWIPFAFMIAEIGYFRINSRSPTTRRKARFRMVVLMINTLIGFAFMIYMTTSILKKPLQATIRGGHILYNGNPRATYAVAPDTWSIGNGFGVSLYVYLIISSMCVTSMKGGRLLGIVSAITLTITLVVYHITWTSTWCFFQAIVSVIIVWMIWSSVTRAN